MDRSILALAYLVRALGLPVCHSFQTAWAGGLQGVVLDGAFGVVGYIFTWVAQVGDISLRRGGIWGTCSLRIFVAGELKTDQVT